MIDPENPFASNSSRHGVSRQQPMAELHQYNRFDILTKFSQDLGSVYVAYHLQVSSSAIQPRLSLLDGLVNAFVSARLHMINVVPDGLLSFQKGVSTWAHRAAIGRGSTFLRQKVWSGPMPRYRIVGEQEQSLSGQRKKHCVTVKKAYHYKRSLRHFGTRSSYQDDYASSIFGSILYV